MPRSTEDSQTNNESLHEQTPYEPPSLSPKRNERSWAPLWVFLLALGCASVNVTKAVHMDDPAYLEIARGILQDPLHPMRHMLFWHGSKPEPVFTTNQPHLFFYVQALVLALFGESELAQHVLMAVVVWAAIWLFYVLARQLAPHNALSLTAMFALGPAFLPGQNLMTDVPQLLAWLAFFWAIFSAAEGQAGRRYLLAALSLTAALLIKYTSLALLGVLPIVMAYRRHYRHMWVVCLPIAGLAAYGLFNYYDFGAVHFLSRPAPPLPPSAILLNAVDWIIGVGAVAPFTIAYLTKANLKGFMGWALGCAILAGVAVAAEARLSAKDFVCPIPNAIFFGLFFANGAFCLSIVVWSFVRSLGADRRGGHHLSLERNAVLGLWVAMGFGFVVLLAPFMAVRHILPVIPAILILMARNLKPFAGRRLVLAGQVATIGLGVALAVSDWRLADVYRQMPAKIMKSLPRGARVWQAGHWGWQWYAEKNGFMQYSSETSVVRPGDYFVFPRGIDFQTVSRKDLAKLSLKYTVIWPWGAGTFFRTMSISPWGAGGLGYYSYTLKNGEPPWRVSTSPVAQIRLYCPANPSERTGI